MPPLLHGGFRQYGGYLVRAKWHPALDQVSSAFGQTGGGTGKIVLVP